jgi:hypothetical protein
LHVLLGHKEIVAIFTIETLGKYHQGEKVHI